MVLIVPSVLGYLILSNFGVMIYDEWSLLKLHGEEKVPVTEGVEPELVDPEVAAAEKVLEDWYRWFGVTLAVLSAFALAIS